MGSPVNIQPVRSSEDLLATRELFGLYAASLPVDLDYQDFESELAALPGKFQPPEGELDFSAEGTADVTATQDVPIMPAGVLRGFEVAQAVA